MTTAASAVLEERTFRPNYSLRVALAMASLASAPLFIWTYYLIEPRIPLILGIAALEVLVCAAICWAQSQTRLTLDSIGLHYHSVFGDRQILWQEVTETRYLVSPVNLGAHFGLLGYAISAIFKPKQVTLSLRVIGGTGKPIKVTSSFAQAKDAIGLILGQVLPPMIADARMRVGRGERVEFGPLTLSSTEVAFKTRIVLPIPEIEKAELAGSNLLIRRAGKWMAAIKVRSDRIPNVLVFLEVLELFAPQTRPAGIDPLGRVRL